MDQFKVFANFETFALNLGYVGEEDGWGNTFDERKK